MTKQAIQHISTQEASKKDERKRGKEQENLFKNHFRGGGEESERRMANNVMQERRVYDGYLVSFLSCYESSPTTAPEILPATS